MLSDFFLNSVNKYLFTIIVFTIVCSYLIYFLTNSRKLYTNLPPGPHVYPVIGNLLDLIALKGKTVETYLAECRKKFGDVFCLRLFNTVVVVFNGYDAIIDGLVAKSHLFSDRQIASVATEIEDQGIFFTNGEQWKQNRRFSMQTLRDFGMGKNILQIKIQEEIKEVLSELEKFNGKPFDIKLLLNCAISNIILSILLGKRYAYDDTEFQKQLARVQDLFAFKNLFFIPRLTKYIPGDPFGSRKFLRSIHGCMRFYERHIDEHIESYDENTTRDLVDAYIKRTRDGDDQKTRKPFKKNELRCIVSDLFAAGSETTATTLKWGLIFLMRDRDLQTRLYNELKENVADNRLPVLQDRTDLPLLEATTLEILRVGNVVPLGMPRVTMQDCSFRGFNIPKGSHIIFNMYTVMTDPETWTKPELFQPSRFITKEGAVCPAKQFIPFSAGPRSCVGELLAKMELFLFFSALVQRFEFLPPDGEDVPTLEGELGVTRMPKPFMVRAIKRQ